MFVVVVAAAAVAAAPAEMWFNSVVADVDSISAVTPAIPKYPCCVSVARSKWYEGGGPGSLAYDCPIDCTKCPSGECAGVSGDLMCGGPGRQGGCVCSSAKQAVLGPVSVGAHSFDVYTVEQNLVESVLYKWQGSVPHWTEQMTSELKAVAYGASSVDFTSWHFVTKTDITGKVLNSTQYQVFTGSARNLNGTVSMLYMTAEASGALRPPATMTANGESATCHVCACDGALSIPYGWKSYYPSNWGGGSVMNTKFAPGPLSAADIKAVFGALDAAVYRELKVMLLDVHSAILSAPPP